MREARVLAVEYKGDAYVSNDDSREKRALGELWEKRSNGRCLFLMAERGVKGLNVETQIAMKITAER